MASPSKEMLHSPIGQKSIEDFCGALCALDYNDREIGLIFDNEADSRYQHRLYRANSAVGPVTGTVAESRSSSKSLEDLLNPQRRLSEECLSRKNRLQIAVVLASSVLQLDGSSWLRSGWSSVDIFFHHKNGQPELDHSYPYLAWQPCCRNDIGDSMESLRIKSHLIRNDTLLNLGLTLVELCFGRTLGDMRQPEDIGKDETETRLRTATRLHKRIDEEMGIPYSDVVRRCLYQPFDVRELSLDIEEVQQKVLDDVVTPLMEDLDNFNGCFKIR